MNETPRDKVLIADDDEGVRKAMASVVRKLLPKMRIIEAPSGNETRTLIEQTHDQIELAVLDSQMYPGPRGSALVIKAKDLLIPHVVLHASGVDDDVIDAIKRRGIHYIQKPASDLEERLRKIITFDI